MMRTTPDKDCLLVVNVGLFGGSELYKVFYYTLITFLVLTSLRILVDISTFNIYYRPARLY